MISSRDIGIGNPSFEYEKNGINILIFKFVVEAKKAETIHLIRIRYNNEVNPTFMLKLSKDIQHNGKSGKFFALPSFTNNWNLFFCYLLHHRHFCLQPPELGRFNHLSKIIKLLSTW